MKLFPRWHTPEEVAKQLIEGLENGTLTVEDHRSPQELVQEFLRLRGETTAVLVRLEPAYTPPQWRTLDELMVWVGEAPDDFRLALEERQRLYAEVKVLEAKVRSSRLRLRILASIWYASMLAQVVLMGYFFGARPAEEAWRLALFGIMGMVVGAWPFLFIRVRNALRKSAQLVFAITELMVRVKSTDNAYA